MRVPRLVPSPAPRNASAGPNPNPNPNPNATSSDAETETLFSPNATNATNASHATHATVDVPIMVEVPVNEILCSYPADGGSMSKVCQPLDIMFLTA